MTVANEKHNDKDILPLNNVAHQIYIEIKGYGNDENLQLPAYLNTFDVVIKYRQNIRHILVAN